MAVVNDIVLNSKISYCCRIAPWARIGHVAMTDTVRSRHAIVTDTIATDGVPADAVTTTESCRARSSTMRTVGVFARVKAKQAVVGFPQAPYEVVEEDRTEDEVEDAVEDHLTGGRDDIATLG